MMEIDLQTYMSLVLPLSGVYANTTDLTSIGPWSLLDQIEPHAHFSLPWWVMICTLQLDKSSQFPRKAI